MPKIIFYIILTGYCFTMYEDFNTYYNVPISWLIVYTFYIYFRGIPLKKILDTSWHNHHTIMYLFIILFFFIHEVTHIGYFNNKIFELKNCIQYNISLRI